MFPPPGFEMKEEIPLPEEVQGWINVHRGNPDFADAIRDFELNRNFYSHSKNTRLLHYCSECGKPVYQGGFLEVVMEALTSKHLCFTCNFWIDRFEKDMDGFLVTSTGEFYRDAGNQPGERKKEYLGHGGREFEVHRYANGTHVKGWVTNNLWHGGRAPWFLLRKYKIHANADVKEKRRTSPFSEKVGY